MEGTMKFGAVYFRKTNPPRDDWERDYMRAAADGHTTFRHWFCWGAIEGSPGVFDWDDYDRQLDLGAKYGIGTVIAEMLIDFPEWLISAYPHARIRNRNGEPRESEMHVSCVVGGHHALCLDNPEVGERAQGFLSELVSRYKDHPALFGYDIWNECTLYSPDRLCHCPATEDAFRRWLEERYGDIRTLAEAWHRYSLTSFDDVRLPGKPGLFPDFLDAVRFHKDNCMKWMEWRRGIIKGLDDKHPVMAHGNARGFADIAPACGDDWRAAEHCDVFGYTYYFGTGCNPFMAGDLIRSASQGREFWRAEAAGDSEWRNRREGGRPLLERDAMHEPENIRLDALTSMAIGARAYVNPRWRPLLDGPLFGAYGWYGMDGQPTERSEMVATLAEWASRPENAGLWASKPVGGEVGILLLEESQAFDYAFNGGTDTYSRCMQGTWQAFFDNNIQGDVIKPHQLDGYRIVYMPFPVALEDSTLQRLIDWVEAGGTLVSEGCPGYFNDRAHAFPQQPSRGLDTLFGCREETVSFAPDRWQGLTVSTMHGDLPCGIYRQSYSTRNAETIGRYPNGQAAIVSNAFGRGKAILCGSMPSKAYLAAPCDSARGWFSDLLRQGGVRPHAVVDTKGFVARISENRNTGSGYLWVLNTNEADADVLVTLDSVRGYVGSVRGPEARYEGGAFNVRVGGRDAAILEFIPAAR